MPVARLRCLSHDDAEAERRLERRLQAEACEKGTREAAEAKEKRTLNRLLCEGICVSSAVSSTAGRARVPSAL